MKQNGDRQTHQQALCSHPEALKLEAGAILDPSHDKQEVRRQHEGHALPLPAQEALGVAQDVAEVDVKQVPWGEWMQAQFCCLSEPIVSELLRVSGLYLCLSP